MRSSWGNVKVVTTRYDTLVYGCKRKPYTRKHPYPEKTLRINPLPREKAAVIMLRRKGYPINMLSKFLGRSTSYIHRILKTAKLRLTLRHVDMRKLPNQTRICQSRNRWRNFQKFWTAWEQFITGECDRPP